MLCLKMAPNYSLLSLLALSLLISFINLPTAAPSKLLLFLILILINIITIRLCFVLVVGVILGAIKVMHETPGLTLADEALQVH